MRQFKKFVSASLLGLGLLYGSSAWAAPQTYLINMDCTDCAQTAGLSEYPVWATLTLDGYTPGTPTSDDTLFVSFFYSGSNLVAPFSVTRSGDDGNAATVDYFSHIPTDDGAWLPNYFLSANLSDVPGPNSFFFAFDSYFVLTQPSGDWSMCAPGADGFPLGGSCLAPSDYGTNAVYTLAAVPEPSELAMLSAGLLLMGAAVRRSKAS